MTAEEKLLCKICEEIKSLLYQKRKKNKKNKKKQKQFKYHTLTYTGIIIYCIICRHYENNPECLVPTNGSGITNKWLQIFIMYCSTVKV